MKYDFIVIYLLYKFCAKVFKFTKKIVRWKTLRKSTPQITHLTILLFINLAEKNLMKKFTSVLQIYKSYF